MQKGKHNIYSKEELLKMIKEGTNAPADMDEFELEALEGLKLLNKPDVLNDLDKEVDEIIIAEKKKENQRKTIYYFSAAASLLLLVSLVFLFKNEVAVKNEKVVAEVEKPKEENAQQELKSPVQEETPITYEAKEPEQEKTLRTEAPVLAEKKEIQKQREGEFANDNALKQNESSLEKDVAAKNISGVIAKDEDVERKEQEVAANQTFGAVVAESNADIASEQQDQQRHTEADKSKKVVAGMSQQAMAFQSNSETRTLAASPGAPNADNKKIEEKAKADLFYANKEAKSKVAKTYKEAAFINGDSTFAAYVKQSLKISSPNNSGIIVVAFLVNKDGTTSNIEIIKSLTDCDVCSKDVIDLIQSIKKWQPAVENGKAITAPKKISLQYN